MIDRPGSDAGYADGVAAARGDRPGDVGAVRVDPGISGAAVVDRVVVAREIPPVHVVDVAVAVVVDAVDRIEGVGPDGAAGAGAEVRMVEVDALVEYADVDRAVRGGRRGGPGVRCVDVRVDRATPAAHGLAGVLQRPLLREVRVVRLSRVDPVGLGVLHRDIGAQDGDQRLQRRTTRHTDQLGRAFCGGDRVARQRHHRRGSDCPPGLAA